METKIKMAVVGSRSITDVKLIHNTLDTYKNKISCIISGGAKGVDTIAENWAIENNIETVIYKPDWNTYGKSAGYKRNVTIIENCDVMVAFWDGQSKGTKHDIDIAKKLRKPYKIILVK